MSGHSKWNNIKNKKGAEDAKRAKVFTQLARQIKSAVKESKSGDPAANPTLRVITDKARAANMPKEKIQRAIDVGLGKSSTGASLQEIMYEAFGPGGVGLLIEAVTDNPNRTSADMRFTLTRGGGSMGGPGAVSYLFARNSAGEFEVQIPMVIEDPEHQAQLQDLIDALLAHDDVEEVYCAGVWPESE